MQYVGQLFQYIQVLVAPKQKCFGPVHRVIAVPGADAHIARRILDEARYSQTGTDEPLFLHAKAQNGKLFNPEELLVPVDGIQEPDQLVEAAVGFQLYGDLGQILRNLLIRLPNLTDKYHL